MPRGPTTGRGYSSSRRLRRHAYRRYWYEYETLASQSSPFPFPLLPSTRTLGVALFVALCLYVVYQIVRTSTEPHGAAISDTRRCPNDEFVAMLTNHSTPDRFILLALVDAAFADMAVNLYESSLRPNRIDSFLFVGVGRRACEILRDAAALPCYHYAEDGDQDVASIYGSPAFIRKMNIRTEMILDALSVGFTVLHTDLDVVFIRNPIADLKVLFILNYSANFRRAEPFSTRSSSVLYVVLNYIFSKL